MKKFFVTIAAIFCLSAPAYANTFSLSVNPLGLIIGVGDFALDVRLTESLSVGGLYTIIDADDDITTIDGNAFGGRVRYTFGKAMTDDAWTLTGSFQSLDADIFSSLSFFGVTASASGTVEGNIMSGIIGYQWVWSNFFIHLGVGVANYDIDVTQTSGSTTLVSPLDGTEAGLDFSLGFAF